MSKINKDNECAHLIKQYDMVDKPLQFMFNAQNELQKYIADKRDGVSPDEDFSEQLLDLAIYYGACAQTEFFELSEAIELLQSKKAKKIQANLMRTRYILTKDQIKKHDLEIQYEYIDIFHFLMNQLLYSGFKPKDITVDFNVTINTDFPFNSNIGNLGNFIDIAKQINMSYVAKPEYENLDESNSKFNNLSLFSASQSYLWGLYLQNTPFKKWKTYEPFSHLNVDRKILNYIANEMILEFLKFAKYLDIDEQMFFNLYMSKNEENINRQKEGGVYHS